MTQDEIRQQLRDLTASIQELRTQAEEAGILSLRELTELVQQHQQTLEAQGERFDQMDGTVQSIHAQQLANAQQLAILREA